MTRKKRNTLKEAKKKKEWLLIFVVGTKPCFYKFWGSIVAAQNYGIPYFIVNAGQHYESILTHGIKEFNYEDKIVVNLSIRGDLTQKAGEIIFKMGWLARYIAKHWPEITPIPIVLGDTILTNAVSMSWMFTLQKKSIHNEAGLRSMYPTVIKEINKSLSVERFTDGQFHGQWELLTIEPFPEQYDTYTASAGCEYLFAPLKINKKHLIREGYNEGNIFVIGGTVVDALELKMKEKPKKSIFSIYPQLKTNKWIRIDIHRKENLIRKRVSVIIGAITELVKRRHYINFVEMNATKIALEQYGLMKDLLKLRRYKNFLYTPVWQEYSHVIQFYNSPNCLLGLTDSGGLQEELNMIGKPCLTLRFNTDRPETVFEGKGNLIVPPISKDFIVKIVDYICKNKTLLDQIGHPKPLYGKDVGKKFIQVIINLMKEKRKLFTWAQERLGFWKEK